MSCTQKAPEKQMATATVAISIMHIFNCNSRFITLVGASYLNR